MRTRVYQGPSTAPPNVRVGEASGTAKRENALEMLGTLERRHGVRPATLGADKGYDAGPFLVELERRWIEPKPRMEHLGRPTGINPIGRGALVADTLSEKHIKIGAKVARSARYVVFQMAEVAVPRHLFRTILHRIHRLQPAKALSG